MARFEEGDRVQLSGDIARYYPSVIGVVMESGAEQASVLTQYRVRLADGTVATFFDFQLQTPPTVLAHVVFDSSAQMRSGAAGTSSETRQIVFVGAGVEIRLKISGRLNKSVVAQLSVDKRNVAGAVVSVLVDDEPIATKIGVATGQFSFHDLPARKIVFETLLPGKRIIASLEI